MAVVLPVLKREDAGNSPLARAVLAGYNRSKDQQERNRLQEILFQRQDATEQRNFERQQQLQENQFGQQQSMADLNFQNQRELQDQRLNFSNQSQQNKAMMIGDTLQQTEGKPQKERFQALLASGVPVQEAVKIIENIGEVSGGGVDGLSKDANKEFQKTLAKEDAKAFVKFREDVNKSAYSSKKQLSQINNMERILEEGLRTGSAQAPLKFVNNLLSSFGQKPLTDAASAAEFQKGALDITMKWLKDTFGNRITEQEFNTISKNAPNMLNSVDANRAILGVLKRLTADSINRQKAMNQVIKERGSVTNLSTLTDERLEQIEEAEKEDAEKLTRPQQGVRNTENAPPTNSISSIPTESLLELAKQRGLV
jgi:hypothetical protein